MRKGLKKLNIYLSLVFAMLAFFNFNTINVSAAASIPTVDSTSGSGVTYNPDASKANQDSYTFSYNIENTANNNSNDSNTATITKYNVNGTGGTAAYPNTVKVKYNGKTYTLKVRAIGDGISPTLDSNGIDKITKITIPSYVWDIKANAFKGAKKVTEVSMGENVKTIDTSAFEGCSSLIKINIKDKTTCINNSAFKGCTSLKKVKIGSRVNSIGASAFEGCISLENVCYWSSSTEQNYYNTLRGTVEDIGDRAFYNCTKLEKLTLAKGVTTLHKDTFGGTTPLTTLQINGNIDNHNGAFQGKTSIQKLVFGSDVTVIYDSMFQGCSGLTLVDFKGTKITDVGAYAFYGCSSLTSPTAFDFTAFDASLTGKVGKYAFKFGGLSDAHTAAGEPSVTLSQTLSELNDYFPTSGVAKVTMNISAESAQAVGGSDYVICLDTTGSMTGTNFCNKCGNVAKTQKHNVVGCTGTIKNQFDITKEVVNNFIDTTLNDNRNNRIAIVIYHPNSEDTFVQGTLVADFSNDSDDLKSVVTRLTTNNSNKGAILQSYAMTDGQGTSYRVGLIAAAKAAQARGGSTQVKNNFTFGGTGKADNPINLVFISDGEANAHKSTIEPMSKICKGLFDNCWSIGICVEESATNKANALKYLKYISTNLNGKELFLDVGSGNVENQLKDYFSSITYMSTASIYNTRLTSTIDSNKWDFYTGYTWSSGVQTSGNTAYIDIDTVDDTTKSYTYYIKLKDTYKNSLTSSGRHTIPVLDKISASYMISGGKYSNESRNKIDDTKHSLYWYAYDVTYNGNGNTGGSTSNQVKIGGVNLSLRSNSFTRTGYKFKEWNTKEDGTGTSYSAGSTYSTNGNLTLYAIWDIDGYEYTIQFDANGGSGNIPSTITKRGADSSVVMGDIALTIPTRSGYIFRGWSASSSWSAKRIAYGSSYGGSSASDGTAAIITQGTWTFANYCYYTGGSVSSRTLTLYAQWEPITYSHTLSYNANGGTGAPSSSTVTNTSSTYSMTVSSTVPTKTGYTFAGWSYNGTIYWGGDTIPVGTNATVTLFAHWTPNIYTLTVNPNGGTMYYKDSSKTTSSFDIKFQYGSNRHLGTFTSSYYAYYSTVGLPLRTGYTFNGWSVTSGGGNVKYYSTPSDFGYKTDDFTQYQNRPSSWKYYLFDGKHAGNVTITAQWEPVSYIIRYDGNNTATNIYGDIVTTTYTGTTEDTKCTYESNVTIRDCGFNKAGYVFKEWNTKSDGSGTRYKGGDVLTKPNFISNNNGVYTLYAIWEPIKYTVTFNGNDNWNNQSSYTQQFRFDQQLELTENKFSRIAPYTKDGITFDEGYNFIGWTYTKNASNVEFTDKQSVKNINVINNNINTSITLYAIWKKDVTLTLNLNKGKFNGDASDIVITKTLYNNDYYYDVPITTYFGNYDNETGMNQNLRKSDATCSDHRFLGYSLNKNSRVPDLTPNDLDVFSPTRIATYRVYSSATLYAVWEKPLQSATTAFRTAGTVGEHDVTNAEVTSRDRGIKELYITAKAGEHITYGIYILADKDIVTSISFDEKINRIYSNPGPWTDNLNDNNLTSNSLNKVINQSSQSVYQDGFYLPRYLGTNESEPTSRGVDEYKVYFKNQQDSYFMTKYKGKKEEAIVILTIKLVNNTDIPGVNPVPDDPQAKIEDLKTVIK